MSHHCQGHSCSIHGSGGMGGHGHSSCTSSCGCSCSACKGSCSCNCCQDSCQGHQDHAKQLLAIADQAWMEVLKERIKDIIRSNDKKLEEMAQIICEANRARWQHKLSAEKCCMDYEEKLKHLIDSHEEHSHSSYSKQGNGRGGLQGNGNQGGSPQGNGGQGGMPGR